MIFLVFVFFILLVIFHRKIEKMFRKLLNWIFGASEVITNELVVSGEGEARIDLGHHFDSVYVFFDRAKCLVPCDPGGEDTLDWEIISGNSHHSNHHHCELVIKWNVTQVRTIVWKIVK